MKVKFTDRVKSDLAHIKSWIAADNPRAASRVVGRILQSAELLVDFPYLGVLWNTGPTRALGVSRLPDRIHYRVVVESEMVQVITVMHTSRKGPRL